jgi:hypothetical protein
VGGGRGGHGQGLELGFEEFAFLVEFGEPGADAGPVGLDGGVVRVGGQVVEFADLGFLGVVDPLDPYDPAWSAVNCSSRARSVLPGWYPSAQISAARRRAAMCPGTMILP